MPIAFSCSCGKAMQAKDAFAGRKLKCPGCGRVVQIPKKIEEETDAEDRAAPTPPRASKPAVRPPSKDEAPPLAQPATAAVSETAVTETEEEEQTDEAAAPLAGPAAVAVADGEEGADPPLARPVSRPAVVEQAVRPKVANIWVDQSLTQKPTAWLPGDWERYQKGIKTPPDGFSALMVIVLLALLAGGVVAAVMFLQP